jgi:DNA-binding CsgD family transcriptional regulator
VTDTWTAADGALTLVGRARELEALDTALAGARAGSGRLVVIEGRPGLGKSALLAEARDRAAARGTRVLTARGNELERDFAFGVALQIFEGAVGAARGSDRDALFTGAAGHAACLFEGAGPMGDPPGAERAFSLLHGLYWIAVNLAERAPLLVAVDDADRADDPSLRFLLYLAQRLDELPIAVVASIRPGEPDAPTEPLAQLAAHRLATLIRLEPLAPERVAQVVRGDAFPEADDVFCAACATVTGGNPFLLHELLGVLRDEGVAPTAAATGRLRQVRPETVVRTVLVRLGRLPAGAPQLARAVAVLGDDAGLRHAASLAGLEVAAAAEAADALAASDILRPGEPLAFAQPLVREAIYADIPAAERSHNHARAARLLHDEGVPAERVASHLLAGHPSGEAEVVGTLRSAAARALERGAPDSAARYLRRALDEPPPAGVRADLLVELGQAEAASGVPGAVDRLREAVRLMSDPRRRARTLLSLGRTLYTNGRFPEAADAFDHGLQELGEADDELAVELEAGYVTAARLELSTRSLAQRRLAPILERAGSGATAAERVLFAHVAFERAMLGKGAEQVRGLAERALDGGALLEHETAEGMAFYVAVCALIWADGFESAEEALDAAVEDARRRGSVMAFATASHFRAYTLLGRGRIVEAMADAHSVVDSARYGWELELPATHAFLSRALLARGDLEEAERLLVLPGTGVRWADTAPFSFFLDARGRLALARGRAEEALADFRECGRRQTAMQMPNPAIIPWRSHAALALAQLGETDRARSLAAEELALARAFGASTAIGVALGAAGVIAGGQEGIERLGEAVAVLEGSPAKVEHAAAMTDLGAALRRSGQRSAAREPLRTALDIAHRCGALAVAERASEELVAAGARPRRAVLSGRDALTPSERRVAEMAARGLSNREIAQSLFVTLKTVEWHLRNAYGKLGITSRRELTPALAGAPLEPDEPEAVQVAARSRRG